MADFYESLREIFRHNESSNYGGVNKNDNGALSIGLLQWHAARALGLMRDIVAIDPDIVRTELGDDIYNQITSGNNNVWNNYIITGDSAPWVNVLTSSAGIQAQDNLFTTDTGSYLSQAKSWGITDFGAQLYFCDLYNQSPKQAGNIARACNGDMSLDNLHRQALANSVMGKYADRRNWTYQYCGGTSGDAPTSRPVIPQPSNPNNAGQGDVSNVNDYILLINNGSLALVYNDNFPNGRVYMQTSTGIYIPKQAYTGQVIGRD